VSELSAVENLLESAPNEGIYLMAAATAPLAGDAARRYLAYSNDEDENYRE